SLRIFRRLPRCCPGPDQSPARRRRRRRSPGASRSREPEGRRGSFQPRVRLEVVLPAVLRFLFLFFLFYPVLFLFFLFLAVLFLLFPMVRRRAECPSPPPRRRALLRRGPRARGLHKSAQRGA